MNRQDAKIAKGRREEEEEEIERKRIETQMTQISKCNSLSNLRHLRLNSRFLSYSLSPLSSSPLPLAILASCRFISPSSAIEGSRE